MIEVRVIDQNSKRIVMEGRVSDTDWDNPIDALTQRWTVAATALVANPGLLAQGRDELITKLTVNFENWLAVQEALRQMQ